MPKATNTSTMADSAEILSIFLSKIRAHDLHSRLRGAPGRKGSSSADIKALLDVLSRLGFPEVRWARSATVNQEELHCVRCHTTYKEKNNTTKSCRIDHDYENYEHSMGGVEYTCDCCGATSFEETAGNGFDEETYCFIGEHTTDEDDIDYEEINSESCKESGCDVAEKEVKEEEEEDDEA